MKIGILSDIHGNQYALREVLDVARRLKIERLLILGDIVGYYYHPDEVLIMLNEWEYTLIKGNHEQILDDILAGKLTEKGVREKYGSGHRKAIEQLSKIQVKMLLDAPESRMITLDSLNVMMCHGSPWQTDYYLYPDSPKEVLDRCTISGIDITFVGHSHYAFKHSIGDKILMNVGSVGQSRSKGGVASWAVLDTETRRLELMTTPYDVKSLLAEVEMTDPDNKYMKDILIRNA